MQNKGNVATIEWRMPLVIVPAIILIAVFFVLKQGHSGDKTYTYEPGEIMSKGYRKNGKYDGAWIFYHENGVMMSQGYFYKDVRDGDWQWSDENGNLEQTGTYEKGVETGVWINYLGIDEEDTPVGETFGFLFILAALYAVRRYLIK